MKQLNLAEFEGYEFNCDTKEVNTGFKHVCEVKKDYKTIFSTEMHYLNRTCESYLYESVLSKAKDKLNKLLNTSLPKINEDFLYKLMEQDIITEYGYIGNDDELTIFMDSWEQVNGTDREWSDTEKCYVKCDRKPSPYAKLVDLAKQGKLKDDIAYTILNTEYAFTDQFMMCEDCGKWFDCNYGEISYIDELGVCLCEDCQASSNEVIDAKIESAIDDFHKAVPVCIDNSELESRGYTKVAEDLSCSEAQWGERRFGCNYIDFDLLEDVCANYRGFCKLTSVQQFDAIFDVWFPDDVVDDVKNELGIE